MKKDRDIYTLTCLEGTKSFVLRELLEKFPDSVIVKESERKYSLVVIKRILKYLEIFTLQLILRVILVQSLIFQEESGGKDIYQQVLILLLHIFCV